MWKYHCPTLLLLRPLIYLYIVGTGCYPVLGIDFYRFALSSIVASHSERLSILVFYNGHRGRVFDNLFQLSMYGLRARHKKCLENSSVFALMSDYSYYTLYFDIKANKIAKN